MEKYTSDLGFTFYKVKDYNVPLEIKIQNSEQKGTVKEKETKTYKTWLYGNVIPRFFSYIMKNSKITDIHRNRWSFRNIYIINVEERRYTIFIESIDKDRQYIIETTVPTIYTFGKLSVGKITIRYTLGDEFYNSCREYSLTYNSHSYSITKNFYSLQHYYGCFDWLYGYVTTILLCPCSICGLCCRYCSIFSYENMPCKICPSLSYNFVSYAAEKISECIFCAFDTDRNVKERTDILEDIDGIQKEEIFTKQPPFYE